MSSVKPYDFMVKYTPQTDWIEGHGILIAFALFFGGISGGLYLSSLFFNSLWGMFIAWILAMAAGMMDMAHLSKPMRFWRMLLRPGTSWISRGFILIWLFLGCAAIQMAISYWAPGGAVEIVFKVLAGILAFGVAIYSGFVVGYVGAIKLWNSAIVPLLFVIAGLTGGVSLLLIVSQGQSADRIVSVANAMLAALVVYAVFVAVYLWVTSYGSHVARDSVMMLLKGKVAPIFWIGVVGVGIVLPIAIVAPFALAQKTAAAAFIIAAVFAIAGGVLLRYSILKAGVYEPLLPAE
jgi:polysulfide reductase chain C